MNWAHLEPEQLVDYFADKWTEDQQEAIENHLSDCDHCAELASRLYESAFDFDGWTAKQHDAVRPVLAKAGPVALSSPAHSQMPARAVSLPREVSNPGHLSPPKIAAAKSRSGIG